MFCFEIHKSSPSTSYKMRYWLHSDASIKARIGEQKCAVSPTTFRVARFLFTSDDGDVHTCVVVVFRGAAVEAPQSKMIQMQTSPRLPRHSATLDNASQNRWYHAYSVHRVTCLRHTYDCFVVFDLSDIAWYP
jgi:hypothetical protein